MPDQKKILLGVTGSVASTLIQKMITEFQKLGQVLVMPTKSSRYFFDESEIKSDILWTDEDEWPNDIYIKDQEVPHITLGDWADVMVIAPLTANTLTKMAVGIADNLLTCTYYAWPKDKPVVIAPAMNTRMMDNPKTIRHINELLDIAQTPTRHFVVSPITKKLACGTTGGGAMADIKDIAEIVAYALS